MSNLNSFNGISNIGNFSQINTNVINSSNIQAGTIVTESVSTMVINTDTIMSTNTNLNITSDIITTNDLYTTHIFVNDEINFGIGSEISFIAYSPTDISYNVNAVYHLNTEPDKSDADGTHFQIPVNAVIKSLFIQKNTDNLAGGPSIVRFGTEPLSLTNSLSWLYSTSPLSVNEINKGVVYFGTSGQTIGNNNFGMVEVTTTAGVINGGFIVKGTYVAV